MYKNYTPLNINTLSFPGQSMTVLCFVMVVHESLVCPEHLNCLLFFRKIFQLLHILWVSSFFCISEPFPTVTVWFWDPSFHSKTIEGLIHNNYKRSKHLLRQHDALRVNFWTGWWCRFFLFLFWLLVHIRNAGLPSQRDPQPDASVGTTSRPTTLAIAAPYLYMAVQNQCLSALRHERIMTRHFVPALHACCGTRLCNRSCIGLIQQAPAADRDCSCHQSQQSLKCFQGTARPCTKVASVSWMDWTLCADKRVSM